MERDMLFHLTEFGLPVGNLPFTKLVSDINNKTITIHLDYIFLEVNALLRAIDSFTSLFPGHRGHSPYPRGAQCLVHRRWKLAEEANVIVVRI